MAGANNHGLFHHPLFAICPSSEALPNGLAPDPWISYRGAACNQRQNGVVSCARAGALRHIRLSLARRQLRERLPAQHAVEFAASAQWARLVWVNELPRSSVMDGRNQSGSSVQPDNVRSWPCPSTMRLPERPSTGKFLRQSVPYPPE